MQQPPSGNDRKLPQPKAFGCGCALSGPGFVLFVLTIVLTMVLASREDLRTSPLWFVLIPLVLGLVLFYTKGKMRKDK